jgi:hypothetical protein
MHKHVIIFFLQAQLKLEENAGTFSPMIKQEATQIQKSYTEEVNSKLYRGVSKVRESREYFLMEFIL